MEPVVVVGAGIAGVACAQVLSEAGLPVRVVDRGRRIGGRLASKRLGGRPVDLGAAYLTVSEPAFQDVVDDWRRRDLVAPWTDVFTALTAGQPATSKRGPVRWGAPLGLRVLVEDLAAQFTVEQVAVEVVDVGRNGRLFVDGTGASAVVLAMPDAQAVRLLGPGLVGTDLPGRLTRASAPVIALVAWWASRTWDDVSPDGHFQAAFVNGDEVIASIADDGRRRGDDAPVLVAHSTPALAADHLAQPEGAVEPMVAALRRLLDVGEPLGTHVHRWSLARPTGERAAPYLLTDDGVGVCGDGWGATTKVETAWLSGRALGAALVQRLVGDSKDVP